MDALKHHKRYLAMLTALSMLVTFIVPLILVEPADSMTGILVCNKTVHTHNAECYVGDTLICDIEEHIHTGQCYKRISTTALKGEGATQAVEPHNDNIPLYNAGGGEIGDTGTFESAPAHEKLDNEGESTGEFYNPAQLPLYTLLFGEGDGHWVDPTKSLDDNLLIANQEYFLGFASDFCAFIESDFTATDADAEGRVFIGGDLIFKGKPDGTKWNYQVGAGDYGQFKPIWKTDEYGHLEGFASGIIGGKTYRLGTMTTGSYNSLKLKNDWSFGLAPGTPIRHTDGNDVLLYPEEGAYKRFIIGNLNGSIHYDEDGEIKDIEYKDTCNHLFYDHKGMCSECGRLEAADMEAGPHGYLGRVNELSQFYIYDGVGTILEKTFATLRARSLSLASIDSRNAYYENENKDLVLDATNIGDAKTVYFKVDEWNENINNVIIKVPDGRIDYAEANEPGTEFTNGSKTIRNLDLNIIISCDDKEISINRNIGTYIRPESVSGEALNKLDEGKGYKINNRAYENNVPLSNTTNNHPVSSNILYNFYDAKTVKFTGDTNFNGTIFAPNADVSSPETCRGHLSGALIARSFYGGLEFGYRPYRGGVDIFGMVSGYAVPVNKFDQDGKELPGALFAIKEDAKFVSLFESGKGTNFAALPSRVDFTGNTQYKAEEFEQGSGDRPYASTQDSNEKLTADVSFELYKTYSNQNLSDNITLNEQNVATIGNVLPKFYLDANQELNFDFNENYNATLRDENNHIYEIQLLKPVTSLTITARNKGDSEALKTATVNFGAMKLSVANQDGTNAFTVGDDVKLTVDNAPTGVTYKYFLNGNEITLNNDVYKLDEGNAGGATFSVSAYADGYEVAQATATKINVNAFTGAGITLSVPDSIISGENLTINVDGAPQDATIKYCLGEKEINNNYNTNGLVGKDLVVKVEITYGGNTVTLQDSVTIKFGTDIEYGAYPNTSDPETATKYNYDVSPYNKFDFWLTNLGKYLDNVAPENKSVTFYFNDKPLPNTGFNNATKDHKQIGDYYTYAIIEANGLQHTVYGPSGTIKYNDNLRLFVPAGPHTAGNNINVNVFDAPDGAKVKFEAYNSDGTKVEWSEERDISGGNCNVVFTPQKSGDYTIIATLKFAENDNKILTATIPVVGRPVTGDLYISANEANTGTEVGLKVSGAPEYADVVFTITDPYGNPITYTGNYVNGEYINSFTPTLAGNYRIKAQISKDNVSKTTEEKTLIVNEKTTTLTGYLSLNGGGVTNPETVIRGSRVEVNVNDITNGATLYVCVKDPGGNVFLEATETINDGAFSLYFNADTAGAYTVTGSLSLGSQNQPLSERKVIATDTIDIEAKINDQTVDKFVVDTPVTLGLVNIPSNADHVDYYLSSYNSNSPMQYVNIDATYNEGDMTITFPPKQAGTHEYVAKAIDANGNVIATVTEYFETVQKSYDGFTITLDKESYSHGEKVTVTVSGMPENFNNVQPFIKDIGGVNNFVEEERGRKYSFTAPSHINVETKRELTFSVFLNDGGSISAKTYITIKPPEQASNVQAASLSYAFRRYLEILAEQNTTDNKVSVEANEDSRIGNLRISFVGNIYESQNKFKLRVAFIHDNNDDNVTYKEYDTVSGSNPYYLDIPEGHLAGNVTKVEITPVEGSVTIDKCYPTYYKSEHTLAKTSATGFTLHTNEVHEIPVDDRWVKALDSITLNLESETDATIYYALVEKVAEGEEAKAPVFKELTEKELLENNGCLIKATNLNAGNIEKILVYTTADSLTVKDYTIGAFSVVDDEYTDKQLKDLKNPNLDIINYYTLVEQLAPTGYFKEETVYTIEVKETIKLDKLVQNNNLTYPAVVRSTVTAKGKGANEEEIVKSYTIEISYIDDDGNFDINRRIIKILGKDDTVEDKFTLKKNGNALTVQDKDNNFIDWNNGPRNGYYLDSEAMMIVPVSDDPIVYTNRKGLLFRKVESSGASVNEAMIQMYKYVGEEWQEVPEWSWMQNKTTEFLFSLDDDNNVIEEGKYYRFHETDAGGKYELAKDIYMVKNGNEIHYWSVPRDTEENKPSEANPKDIKPGAKPEDPNGYDVLNLEVDNVIRMENYRIPGLELTLSKTNVETGDVIDDSEEEAIFSLYSYDDIELLSNIVLEDGKANLNLSAVTDERYVENGYIKPGTYYLKELKAPTGYEASMDDFYFTISKDISGVYRVESAEILPGVLSLSEKQDDGSYNDVIIFKEKALKQIAELIKDEKSGVNENTPIMNFVFNTPWGQRGWGNAQFSAIINKATVPPDTNKYPASCYADGANIKFQDPEAAVQMTVKQLCDLFGVAVANFDTITEFKIRCWNQTTISDVGFYPLQKLVVEGILDDDEYGDGISDGYMTFDGWDTYDVIMFSQDALNRITDDMITGGKTIVKFTLQTPDNDDDKNKEHYGFVGVYDGQTKIGANDNTGNKELVVELTARQMLEKIGITTDDSNLLENFRKLTNFKIRSKSPITVTKVEFFGADPVPDNTPEENTSSLKIPTLTTNGANLIASNAQIGTEMKLRVQKKWEGDEGVTELRKPVKVKLQRKEGVGGTYADYTPSGVDGEQTLSADNGWQYMWEDLPMYKEPANPENSIRYYYTVVEKTPPTGYIPVMNENAKDLNSSGTIVITNKADTIDIPIAKTWNTTNLDAVPNSVRFKLQAMYNGEWIDLPNRTLLINKPDGWNNTGTPWTGAFENLPVGYEYRVVEYPLPYTDWSVDANSKAQVTATKTENEDAMEDEDGFAVTNNHNPKVGNLGVGKDWQGGQLTDRPEQLKLRVYRTIAKPYFEKTDAPYVEEGNDYKTDYARLLQHSLFFYDANMCGNDVSANSALAWRSNCHIEDEVPGGYHDAGDHVMFGLPQGYTATMLGWSYYEFMKEDTTHNIDPADKAHLKVILERFYDFFVDSVHYVDNDPTKGISEILVQKGNGTADHSFWGAPEVQDSRVEYMYWSDHGAEIAGEYAAALALGYLNFYDENGTQAEKDKYNNYLVVAKKLFEFGNDDRRLFNEVGINIDETIADKANPGFYSSESCEDDLALAAGWLYKATNDEEYKKKYNSIGKNGSFWGFSWNDVSLAAMIIGAEIGGKNGDNNITWSDVSQKIKDKISGNVMADGYFKQDNWGSARYNAIMQTAALVVAKYHEPDKQHHIDWAKQQMTMLLGGNNWQNPLIGECDGGTIDGNTNPVCLITGFVPDGTNVPTPQAPHHRAASGWESLEEYKVNCGYNTDKSHQLIGALVGGPAFGHHDDGKQLQMHNYNHDHPLLNHTYIDDLHDYCCNEVSLDYNAGLVGAAAGLYYFTGLGKRSTMIEGVEIQSKAMGEGTPQYVKAYTPNTDTDTATFRYEPVSAQVGYNMVPFRRTGVRVMTGEALSVSGGAVPNNNNASRFVVDISSLTIGDSFDVIFSGNNLDYGIEIKAVDGQKVGDYTIFANTPKTIPLTIEDSWKNWPGAPVPTEIEILNYYYTGTLPNVSARVSGGTDNPDEPETPALSFTNDTPNDYSSFNLLQEFTLKTNENAKWTANDNVNLSTAEGTSCTVKFVKYSEDLVNNGITITATSTDGKNTTISRTYKLNKISVGLSSDSVTAGTTVQFSTVGKPDSITAKYCVNEEEINGSSFAPPEAGKYNIKAKLYNNGNYIGETATKELQVAAIDSSGINITNGPSNGTAYKVRESISITADSTVGRWYSNKGDDIVQITGNSDKSCTVTILKYTTDDITITAEKSGDSSKTASVTIKAQKLSFTVNSSEVTVGTQVTFTPNYIPNGATIRYYAQNNNQLVESDQNTCNYTPNNSGDLQITAKAYYNGTEIAASDVVALKVNAASSSSSLAIKDKPNELYNGGSYTFTADKPDNASYLRWSVTGNSKVSINAETGELTVGHDANNQKITVTVKSFDGNNTELASDSCEVEIRKMSITDLNASMLTGGVDDYVKAEGKPSISNITWSAEPSDMVRIENPSSDQTRIIALDKAGTVTIIATAMNNGNVVAVAKKNVTISEYVPDAPTGYKLITSYTYPENIRTVTAGNDLKIELDNILGNHPVDAVIVEFEKSSFNGIVFWDKNSETAAEANPTGNKYKYDSCDNFTIKFNEVGYTNGQTRPDYFTVRYWWAQNNGIKVKKVHFYAETLEPTMFGAEEPIPESMPSGNELQLKVVGFDDNNAVNWSISGGDGTIENGLFIPTSQGEYTITASYGGASVEKTINVTRAEIKIGFNEELNELSKTVKYNEVVDLYSSEDVTYELVPMARIDYNSLVVIDNGNKTVSISDHEAFGTAKLTVTIQGYVNDGEKIVSNPIQLTFVGKHSITGDSELAPNTSGQLAVENALGQVTWNVKDDAENYSVDRTNSAEYIVRDRTSNNIILKLNTSNGKITAGADSGTVTIIATADGETAEYTVKIKDLPMMPIIPTEGKELVTEVILTAGNNWESTLSNLPLTDLKGNPYHYYVEEFAYKKKASDKDWTLIYNNTSLGFIHAGGSFIPVSYTGNGNVLDENVKMTISVGNKATEKPQGTLPSTGGSGVTTYYYLGGVIMLLSIAGFTGLKRREKKRRKE